MLVPMDIIKIVDMITHMDAYLNQAADWLGPWLYVLLFLIIFCETGLVVTPILPGDSLLFAIGALTTVQGAVIDFWPTLFLLIVAAILGDAVNYSIGHFFGPKIFTRSDSRWLNKQHLVKTHEFYEKYGGKTIIIARFLPIVRTFAPFVAGIGKMQYRRFAAYNVVGAILWVAGFLWAGQQFGNLPVVKRNFHFVVFGIIGVSLLPLVYEFIKSRRKSPASTSP